MSRLNWEQIARLSSPPLDRRDLDGLVREMESLVPYYTPEWRFNRYDPDAGTALFYIAADMLLENWKRLNQAPLNHYVSFLNLIGVEPMNARAATTYLTFTLSEGSVRPVLIPALTPVSATTDDGEILFETAAPLLVTPARITDLYMANGDLDQVIRVPLRDDDVMVDEVHEQVDTLLLQPTRSSYRLFDTGAQGMKLPGHMLYTACPELEHLSGAFRLEWIPELEPAHHADAWCALLANPAYAEWSYMADGQWQPFEQVQAGQRRLYLYKAAGAALERCDVQGVAAVWIRCVITSRLSVASSTSNGNETEQPEHLFTSVRLGRIHLRPTMPKSAVHTGIAPLHLLQDDLELEKGRVYLFGSIFYTYGCLYIHSPEIFSRRGSTITMKMRSGYDSNDLQAGPNTEPRWRPVMRASEFETRPRPYATIRQVSWEYWNGQAWVRLVERDSDSLQFDDNRRPGDSTRAPSHEAEEGQEREWHFHCPQDLQPYPVNGIQGHWIRTRIIDIDQAYAPYAIYRSPWIEQLTLSYQYPAPFESGGWVSTNQGDDLNPAERIHHGKPIVPFCVLENGKAACYIALDQPPTGGPLHLYLELEYQQPTSTKEPAHVDWQYWQQTTDGGRWSALDVYDFTEGLTMSGHIQWAGPPDFGYRRMFGRNGYWLRAIDRYGRFGSRYIPYPSVRQFHWNTVPAIQQQSIRGEKPDLVRDREGLYCRLLRHPVHDEEVWVDDTAAASPSEWLLDEQQHPDEIRRESVAGQGEKVWRRWHSVTTLRDSLPDDRHYTIDRLDGMIRFGDGRNGSTPGISGVGAVMVHYRLSSGHAGNVHKQTIIQPAYARAFIQDVFNPVAAYGGHDRESTAAAVERGPMQLRHRQRAVTAEDYEQLAQAADAHVVRVRCFSGYNGGMEREAGSVALVVLARDEGAGNRYFPELAKRVRQYLLPRMSGMIFAEQLYVIEPVSIEVCVAALMVVSSLEQTVIAEEMGQARLERFLDPIVGKADGKGWQIGEQPQLAAFYPLLQSVPGVRYVQQLTMEIFKVQGEVRQEITLDQAAMIRHGMVRSGEHRLQVYTDWN